jgi:hypothetical protein
MHTAWNPDAFVVEEFYKYPTCVIHRIAEYDEKDTLQSKASDGFHKGSLSYSDDDIKELFDNLLKRVEQQLGQVRDNKIAMKVLYKPTNTTLYVGYKDWNWCVGLALNPHMTGECVKLTALAG